MARIKDNSAKFRSEYEKKKKEKLTLAALLVERTAKENCPVRTGTARRSINRIIKKTKAIIGSNVVYFKFIELGTSKMAAFAPLRRALETNRQKIKRLFGAR